MYNNKKVCMAKVRLTKKFTMCLDDVRKGMQDIAQRLQDEQGMTYKWVGEDRVEFSHKTGKGSLHLEGGELVLELKIGLLYSAAAPVVKKKIMEFADKYIT